MSFRPFQVGTQFFANDGATLANGTLTTSISGTSTPKNTFSDPGLSVSNGPVVQLTAAGRPDVDIWADGLLRIVLKNSLGVVIETRDNVGADDTLPDQTGHTGEFLTTDGSDTSWTTINEVPDPAGAAGQFLTTDGTDIFFDDLPPSLVKQTVIAEATTTLDYALGQVVELTQDVNITTLDFDNLPASGIPALFIITRIKDNTATARTITSPASFKWEGATPPTLTQTANAVDQIGIMTWDAGATWYARANLNFA